MALAPTSAFLVSFDKCSTGMGHTGGQASLLIDGIKFKVITPRTQRNKAVDYFFTSLAEAFKERAIGIILSGYDGDGTEGCKHIKNNGGTTFAQDKSAEVNHMPLSALASGYIDFVLPLDKMSIKLQKMANST